ncbi:hypothetical protein HYH03_001138 [Edaphochlamys debaryana]|uniref:AMP-dependent synthetase/ligase domain-containing protein n=1 Tax=Edaphochlamys debaryana TaxID=47281 RepID=A0A835YER8_9CHLO|nr:hypothetical protein HYH03_001138 [Edaphochlamys debaryana]|eukprot:KAG2501348.1 hypothetical protein HYH03_001138 [Edaphochlamys debaryana]
MALPVYHQGVLDAVAGTGICTPAQLADFSSLLRDLSGDVALDGPKVWRHLATRVLLPSHAFPLHLRLAAAAYEGWPADALGRPPLWLPEPQAAAETNAGRFLASLESQDWWREAAGPALASAAASGPLGPSEALVLRWRLLQCLSWERPEPFWRAALGALRIEFHTPPSRMLQPHPSDPDQCRWLPGARLNIAAAALGWAGTGGAARLPPGRPALLWAPDGAPRSLVPVGRAELLAMVRAVAAAARRRFKPGDAVAVYLPLSPTSVAAYLGLVLAGCCLVSVADSFSGAELAERLRISRAVAVVTQDVVLRGGKALPLYGKVAASGTTALALVVPASEGGGLHPATPPLRPGDLPWASFLAAAPPGEAEAVQPHWADAYEVTNVLFSSGTTGEPKAIPWTHVTPLRCALDGWAQLDIREGSVVCWPTSLGWMMGPWLLYAALLNGATVALYGGAPLGPDFLSFVTAARVDVLGLVPSIVRAWRHASGGGGGAAGAGGTGAGGGAPVVDLSCVRVFGSTGEASAAEDYHWLMSRGCGYRPVVEYCGGTEIGGGYLSSTLLHPCAPSTFATPTLGARLVLLTPEQSEAASEAGPGGSPVVPDSPLPTPRPGEVALAMPMLGCSQRLLNKDHGKVYYDGMPRYGSRTGLPLRRHGDEVAALRPCVISADVTGGGGGGGGGGGSRGLAAVAAAAAVGPSPWAYAALGRCDDTMNLGGIKVSSVELERAVSSVELERAVVSSVELERAVSSVELERAVLSVELERAVSSVELERAVVSSVELERAVSSVELERAVVLSVELERAVSSVELERAVVSSVELERAVLSVELERAVSSVELERAVVSSVELERAVSSVELERAVVAAVPGVAEAAAVGVAPPQGGPEELTLFLVLAPPAAGAGGQGAAGGAGAGGPEALRELTRQCGEALRTRLNPLFKVSRVALVPALPRNASNKVMRRVLREGLPRQSRM